MIRIHSAPAINPLHRADGALATPCCFRAALCALRFRYVIVSLGISAALAAVAADLPLLPVFSDISDAGLELHVVSVPQTPVVALRVYVLGGVYGENERRGSGLAFLMQEALMDAWREARETAGPTGALARISSTLDYDALCFSAVTTREYYPAVLRQLADVLSRLRLSDAAWQRVRDRVSRRLLLDLNDQPYQLLNLYRRAAYLWHPVRTPLRGEHSLFADLSRDDLMAYHHQYFVAGNVVVVLAGDLNSLEAASHVADAFATLPHQSVALPPGYEEPVQGNQRWLERRADVTQSYVCVGFITVPEGHRDSAALDVLARLLDRERDAMLNALGHTRFPAQDFTLSHTSAPRCRNAFIFTYRQDARAAATSARALAAWLQQRAHQPWREADVRSEIELLLAQYRAQLTDPAAMAHAVGHAYLRTANPYFPRTRAERWDAVTPADVQRVCRTYFQSAHLTTVLIQPHDSLSERDNVLRGERDLVSALNYPLRRLVLDNGLTLLLRQNPQEPLVHVRFSALGGGWCEDRDLPGVFSLLGALMCDAPEGRSSASFERACRAIGLVPRFDVAAQHITLHGTVAPQYAEAAVALLCDAWGAPAFSREAQDRALVRMRGQLLNQSTNLSELANMLIRASLFEQQPYGLNWLGTPDSLARLTWRDAQQAWRQFCVPGASTLLVSGDFDDARIEAAVQAATRRWRPPLRSEFFFDRAKRFVFHSDAPAMTVVLQPEPARTAAITRVYASANPLSLVACGINAPALNATNFPPYIAELARGALALALDNLRQSWRDPDDLEIVHHHAAIACSGYDTGWLYAWLAVSPQFTSDAARRLTALFQTTLRELSAGELLPAARARALFDLQLAQRDPLIIFDDIMRNHLFGYDKRLPLGTARYFDACTPELLSSFCQSYARFPVTIIVAPE